MANGITNALIIFRIYMKVKYINLNTHLLQSEYIILILFLYKKKSMKNYKVDIKLFLHADIKIPVHVYLCFSLRSLHITL